MGNVMMPNFDNDDAISAPRRNIREDEAMATAIKESIRDIPPNNA